MNKRINFEDTIFVINVRLRLVRDQLALDIEAEHFYKQTVSDIDFINSTMEKLTERFLENLKFLDREAEADNILDAEWQFSQLLNVISVYSSPFSSTKYPEMTALVNKLTSDSKRRKKQIEDSYVPAEQFSSEPVVSHAELNGLLGSA